MSSAIKKAEEQVEMVAALMVFIFPLKENNKNICKNKRIFDCQVQNALQEHNKDKQNNNLGD